MMQMQGSIKYFIERRRWMQVSQLQDCPLNTFQFINHHFNHISHLRNPASILTQRFSILSMHGIHSVLIMCHTCIPHFITSSTSEVQISFSSLLCARRKKKPANIETRIPIIYLFNVGSVLKSRNDKKDFTTRKYTN